MASRKVNDDDTYNTSKPIYGATDEIIDLTKQMDEYKHNDTHTSPEGKEVASKLKYAKWKYVMGVLDATAKKYRLTNGADAFLDNGYVVRVTNMPPNITPERLITMFSKRTGIMAEHVILRNREKVAYITFDNPTDCFEAVERFICYKRDWTYHGKTDFYNVEYYPAWIECYALKLQKDDDVYVRKDAIGTFASKLDNPIYKYIQLEYTNSVGTVTIEYLLIHRKYNHDYIGGAIFYTPYYVYYYSYYVYSYLKRYGLLPKVATEELIDDVVW